MTFILKQFMSVFPKLKNYYQLIVIYFYIATNLIDLSFKTEDEAGLVKLWAVAGRLIICIRNYLSFISYTFAIFSTF